MRGLLTAVLIQALLGCSESTEQLCIDNVMTFHDLSILEAHDHCGQTIRISKQETVREAFRLGMSQGFNDF
ncbi:hypothetical protein [Vibrio taketomensis]|uniref:hypothetical protein n=1 Tax=Vibrio taketomensis TaxID=2572923 RepID=UPI00138A1608|nr:hypothetical protein [Vibrio taketomensis]